MTGPELSVAFFLQMFFILAVCRVMGALARLVHQPQVIGEMIAGVLMGPSLLGWLWPVAQKTIFPPESLKVLYVVSQLGIGLYMFLVGVDFDTSLFRSRLHSAAAVSVAGIIVPFVLGAGLAFWLIKLPGLFSERVTVVQAMLFLGSAVAITAFPVLARIIYERGLTGTALGTLTLGAGAISDAAAWGVFAIVLASIQKLPDGSLNTAIAVRAIAGGIVFASVLILAGRKWLAPLERMAEREQKIPPALLGLVLALFCLCAWLTDFIGLHAIFGGFLLGTAMPRGNFARELQRKLEPLTVVFLLPIFFAYSGLNTRLDIVSTPQMLLVALVILAVSCVGKGGACWAAARFSGEDNRTALAVGTLMNCRGLMELILLNIGLQHGIIQPALFSMMVLMAVVTTLMASPLFERVYGRHARKTGALGAAHDDE